MRTNFKRVALAFLAFIMILCTIPVCIAADAEIKINSVTFEEYFDHSGDKNERMVSVTTEYTVSAGTESVTLILLAENTTNAQEIMSKAIYINQIDNPTGRYVFPIEKSKISEALGVDNIEGSTLYLKMGGTAIDLADTKQVLYITPSPLTFDGASIRTQGEQGLKFTFSIPRDLYEKLQKPGSYEDTNLGFGSVVMPRRYLGQNELVKNTTTTIDGTEYSSKTVPAVKICASDENYVWFNVVITDIAKKNYTQEYVAVPYITYLDNGVETTVYGPQSQGVTVFAVAELAYAGNETAETKEYLYNKVLSVVDPERYPKN